MENIVKGNNVRVYDCHDECYIETKVTGDGPFLARDDNYSEPGDILLQISINGGDFYVRYNPKEIRWEFLDGAIIPFDESLPEDKPKPIDMTTETQLGNKLSQLIAVRNCLRILESNNAHLLLLEDYQTLLFQNPPMISWEVKLKSKINPEILVDLEEVMDDNEELNEFMEEALKEGTRVILRDTIEEVTNYLIREMELNLKALRAINYKTKPNTI